MYLERIELQGFKSFAQKTVLKFLPPKGSVRGITSIVGPNGSGKSNVADAIRWVLGEQSLKMLRGKKGEDVIFAGSENRARLGFAEVALILNNSERDNDIDLNEIAITRRLYRDGESEYMVNGRQARLHEIALMLARAHFGQKSYTVIGQGMIDSILLATPAERKEFFDEAAGVKEFQIKRAQAVNKLAQVRENLTQAEALAREIEPRVRSLGRQVKRLEEREAVAQELIGLQTQYYGALWHDLNHRLREENAVQKRLQDALAVAQNEEQKILVDLHLLEKTTTQSEELFALQKSYEKILAERTALHEEHMRMRSQLEIDRVRAETRLQVSALPSEAIATRLSAINTLQEELISLSDAARTAEDMRGVCAHIRAIYNETKKLLNDLREGKAQKGERAETAPESREALQEIESALASVDAKLQGVQAQMQKTSKNETHRKGQFFELQRLSQAKQQEVFDAQQAQNNVQVQVARLETRMEALEEEMQIETPNHIAEIKLKPPETPQAPPDVLQPQIMRLKHQLELIGGIDQEVVDEYKETKERYDFLAREIEDLQKTLVATDAAIIELDRILKTKRDEALTRINAYFDQFFKMVFNGGKAQLVPLYAAETEEDENAAEDAEAEEMPKAHREANAEPVLAGIDIQATPPGKRIKDINMLSGGERAMTSVALICAILAHHPSPFVVLDEVDAALDESNSIRFADIIEELSAKTQFIVITHNRASMAKAQILYGVTMGEDGVSQLLSVRLEQAEQMANR